jgi:hypothetical protein
MYSYFEAEGSQVTPDTVSHYKYKRSIRRCMRQNQGSILVHVLYGLDTGAPYLFCSHNNWYFYREWQQKGMESLWFELRLFPLFYRHKQTK